MSATNDGSESVDQFLARIASVKEGRDEANEARTRRMEDEILKGRQERQARRLERARSISPSKTGPAKVSTSALSSKSASQSTADLVLNPPVDFSPQSQFSPRPQQAESLSRSNAVTGRSSPTKGIDAVDSQSPPSSNSFETTRPHATVTGLARSGTLSWQQRPSSRDGSGPRQRPLSGFATVRSLPRPPPEDEQKEEPTRKDIAASLAQKDPTWFRQTQDRGNGSAAFRKNQVEDSSESHQSTSMRLPGMSPARESSKSPAPESRAERQVSRDPVEVDRFKRGTTPDIIALRESIARDRSHTRPVSQEPVDPRPLSLENETSESSTPSLARSSSALSSNRPVSPTKGLGGFVESAMMRRSDSVSKRWSVKANTGLKRGDSVAGGRPPSLHSRGLSRDILPNREGTPSSPLASSRPSSSHGRDQPMSGSKREKSMSVEPQESANTRVDAAQVVPEVDVDDSQLARSPSKTMDPRRWSPTKSTWLESALQAESPKPPPQPLKEEQPKWKVDLQRSRSRANRDVSPEKQPQQQVDHPVSTKTPTLSSVSPQSQPSGSIAASSFTHPKVATATSVIKDEPMINNVLPPKATNPDIAPAVPSRSVEDRLEKEIPQTDAKDAVDTPKKPPVLKPKPQTPPKTDFRAALKSRTTGPSQNDNAEPEFKTVFGKLKRATTQNYVAPDELKTNILGGKAALNVTGGPQKTKRVDEFKESILAKKEAMKAAGSKSPQRSESPVKEEAPIPEALARRKTLSKASAPNLTSLGAAPGPVPKPTASSKAAEPAVAMRPNPDKNAPAIPAKMTSKTQPEVKTVPEELEKSRGVQARSEIGAKTSGVSADVEPRFAHGLQQVRSTSPARSSQGVSLKMTKSNPLSPPVHEIGLASSTVKNELPVGSKLASRLNPNLAAMLSRGGSPRPQTSRNVSDEDASRTQDTPSLKVPKEEEAGSLTHMTKARAKGPKRRAPKSETTTASTTAVKSAQNETVIRSPPTFKSESTVSSPAQFGKTSEATVAKDVSHKPSAALRELSQPRSSPVNKTPVKSQATNSNPVVNTEELKTETAKAKPVIASKSPELRKVSSPPSLEEKIKASPKPSPDSKPAWSSAAKPVHTEKTTSAAPVRPVSPTPEGKSSLLLNKIRGPETATQTKEVKPTPPAKTDSVSLGLGIAAKPAVNGPKPVTKPRTSALPRSDKQRKPEVLPSEIKRMIENYVGPISKDYEKAEFDSQQFLSDINARDERTKTTNVTVSEITGDGKKSALPPQQEHILYEESMYLIIHAFSTSNGASGSEVYLWCGDRVSDAAVEDAQIFCRRDAREHNTKLAVYKQGKEPSGLIQALGGILIVRRNKSSALYMLCGRRHLGHIVFDEVEMESSNLCSGYAYLISMQYGKLYLWKGQGACADEVGSARLIGMDLGLTGEIEEVDDGKEPASFWEAFGSTRREEWSDDWAKRADLNGYPTVMYRIEHERPGLLGNLWGLKRAASPAKGQQVKATCEQLQSFSQSDLESATIHILDAYRALYVIITRQCSSKAAELVTALHLAQDFAMFSPATQDRPLLPACFVVAGDFPNDVKACFRKWSALEAQATAGKDSICVRLEEVMEALDL